MRCTVQFETASDMHDFVMKWICKYGLARQNKTKIGLKEKIVKETREFFRIFWEYFKNEGHVPYDQLPAAVIDIASLNSTSDDEDFKLFEIHRIRNRLDPDLDDAPGGYRDLALKLKIGFVRYGF